MDRKYYKVNRNVTCEDHELLEILGEINAYAKENDNFDPSFAQDMEEKLEYQGFITDGQYNALVNAYYAFRMQELPTQESIDNFYNEYLR